MDVRNRVIKITELLGMKGTVASRAMGVTYATYRNKMNENNKGHTFNQKNLDNLKAYIKEKTKEIQKL